MNELREKIDALCHENRLLWEKATAEAMKREAEIRALEDKLADAE